MSAISSFSTANMDSRIINVFDEVTERTVPVRFFYERNDVENGDVHARIEEIIYFNMSLVCTSPRTNKEEERHFQIETINNNINEDKHIEYLRKLVRFCILPTKIAPSANSRKLTKKAQSRGIKIAGIFTCEAFTATPRYNVPTTGIVVQTPAAPREEKKS